MIRIISLVLGLMFISQISLAAPAAFDKHFQLVKNSEGKVLAIRMKTMSTSFKVRPYLMALKDALGVEKRRYDYKQREDLVGVVSSILDEQQEGLTETIYQEDIVNSIFNLKNVELTSNMEEVINNPLFGELQDKLDKALLGLDLTLIANLEDSRFFYRRQVIREIIIWAIEQAQQRFGEVPVLNTALFMITEIHKFLLEQKLFSQNMFLYYADHFKSSELGLTDIELNHAVSSIYEYRIEARDFMQSRQAVETWDHFGWDKFYVLVRTGNTRIRDLSSGLGPVVLKAGKKLSFAFSEFEEEGQTKIYHLLINKHQFSGKPALAYDYANPKKVKKLRAMLTLAKVGLSFLPINDGFKKPVANFMDSMMVNQRRMEGALIAYFETQENSVMTDILYNQLLNPYINP